MKKSIIPVAAFIAGMAIVPSVFAAGNGDNTTRYVRWGGAEGAVSDCLKSDAETCKLDAGDFDFNVADGNVATITKSKVLDLNNGHTLTHEDNLGAVLLSVAGKGVTLTIQNGTIDMQGLDWATVSVSDGASLVIADNATIKATTPVSTHDAKKVTINGMRALRDTARTHECPGCFASLLLRSGGCALLRRFAATTPAACALLRLSFRSKDIEILVLFLK